MPRYIAFLRAINVGRGRTVKMGVLRQIFQSLGFTNVETFIASGNVVFESTARRPRAMEEIVEDALIQALGYEVATFIRTDVQVAEIAQYRSFRSFESDADVQLSIVFFRNPLDAKTMQKVRARQTQSDEFHVHGCEVYWLRRRQPELIDFSNVPLDETLGQPVTIRGANTVKRIAAKYCR